MSDRDSVVLPETLYGALIALQDDALLVPNSALVEVAPGERLQRGASHGCLGTLEWRGTAVPVASFEAFNGQPAPDVGARRSRIVVLHALGEGLRAHVWALYCVGYPRMLPLSAAALEATALHEHDRPDVVLARVRLGVRDVAIPDLERIEAGLLAEASRSA